MKIFFVSILLLFSTFVFAQKIIEVDTILVNYRLQGIVDITSHIPQIKGEIDPVVMDKINADIKGYFMADIQDSTAYVNELLENYGVITLDDYFKELEEFGTGDEGEGFEFTYITADLLNFTYSYSMRPYMGQYQFYFWSVVYDLRTGNKLNFNDFFTIDRETFISIFQKKGYYVSWLNGSTPFEILPAIDYYDDVENNINELFPNDTIEGHNCIEFYFEKRDSTPHLMLKLQCAGPYLQDYGIALSDLLPYIKYYPFKNEFE